MFEELVVLGKEIRKQDFTRVLIAIAISHIKWDMLDRGVDIPVSYSSQEKA